MVSENAVWIDGSSLMMPSEFAFLNQSPMLVGCFEVILDDKYTLELINEWLEREGEFVMITGSLADAVDNIVNGLPEASPSEFEEWAEFFEQQARKLREAVAGKR